MDHWNIADYDEDARTAILGVMKVKLVRAEIIMKYTLIDEFLSVIISHYYFIRPKKGASFRALWQTKKFKIFSQYVLDEMYLLPKMRLVHAIKEIPSDVRNAIERINAVRNAIAHSFFPENRRQYSKYKNVMYRDADLYTKEGVEKFIEDAALVEEHLMHRAGWI